MRRYLGGGGGGGIIVAPVRVRSSDDAGDLPQLSLLFLAACSFSTPPRACASSWTESFLLSYVDPSSVRMNIPPNARQTHCKRRFERVVGVTLAGVMRPNPLLAGACLNSSWLSLRVIE